MSTRAPIWDRPITKVASGRLAAKLFVAAGLLAIANNNIPPVEHLNRPVLYAIGVGGAIWGLVCWRLPWERLPPRSQVVNAVLALTLVAGANVFGGVSAYSYAVYFVVVFVFVGLTQPPLTSVALAPVAAAAYAVPTLFMPDAPAIAALSASVAIPACVLVGEVISRATERAGRAKDESEHRARLLETVARASRRTGSLEADAVLQSLVDVTCDLGFDASAVVVYDEIGGTHTPAVTKGLPRGFERRSHPISSGIAGVVRRRRATVIVDDYSSWTESLSELRDSGFRAVVACPVRVEGRLGATLIAGIVADDRQPSPQDVEALELLAAQAGRALENAERFAAEQRSVERLSHLDRLKRDFVSNISHELRTPLTVIEGIGQTLQERWHEMEDAVRGDFIDRLNRNARALDEIITTLLDFSRLQEGRIELHRRDVDLRGLCASVVARLRTLLSEHELVLALEEPVAVQADPVLLERVVENLVANAARHTPAGTRVEISVRTEGTQAVVAVSDDGPGIPADELPQIGHRFFRGGEPDTRPSRGTGLGLAFSREVLRLHGSALEIHSHPGEGACFSFTLPVQTAPIEISPATEHTRAQR